MVEEGRGAHDSVELVYGLAQAAYRHQQRPRVSGRILDDFDLGIAACALVHNLTLVTHNSAHFERVRGLRLDDWCAASGG